MNIVSDARAKKALSEVISGKRSSPTYILYEKARLLVTIGEG